jgi:tetratricopeptide (TPR) repeat protein
VNHGIELSTIDTKSRIKSPPLIAAVLVVVLSLSGCVSAEDRLAQLVKEFEQSIGEDDLVKARELYEEAYRLMPDTESVKPLGQTLVNIELSKKAFDSAEMSANTGDHLEAAELYLEVNKVDTLRFNDATSKLIDSVRLSIQEALGDSPLITQKRILEFAIDLSDSRPELKGSIQSETTKLADAYREGVISAISGDIDKGRFDDAKYTLNSALQTLPREKSLRELSDTLDSLIERQERAALSAMYKKTDSFEGIDWYYDRATYSSYAGNKFFLYIGKQGAGQPWLRLRMMYAGSDWIFWETLTVSVDGEKFSFNPGYYEVERDNYTTVWEWYDTAPDSGDLAMIEKIITSKNTTLRFEGETYRADRVLSSAQKRAFKNVLVAYKALGG